GRRVDQAAVRSPAPHLVGSAGDAVPQFHVGAIGGAATGDVQAAAGRRVLDRVGLPMRLPHLAGPARAGGHLHLRAGGGAATGDVLTLPAYTADRAGGVRGAQRGELPGTARGPWTRGGRRTVWVAGQSAVE